MINHGSERENLFGRTSNKGLVNEHNRWLEKAVEQKNPRLNLALANSVLLTYDQLDGLLVSTDQLN